MRWMLVLLVSLFFLPAVAQGDEPVVSPILYNSTVTETITNIAIFDWWQVQAAAGDVMRVQMIASDGLAPQLAVLSPVRDRVATSDPGEPNGQVSLQYTVPEEGLYTLLATRVDGSNGTTSGGYSLTLQRLNQDETTAPADDTGDVVFVCNGEEMAVLAAIEFVVDEPNAGQYPIYVYGFDGLLPAIRFQSSAQNIDVCHRNAQYQAGDVLTLPNAESLTLQADQLDSASQLTVNAADTDFGTMSITFGAPTAAPGRYMAVIGGFSIEPSDDIDTVRIHAGGLTTRNTAMQVYMIGVGANSRLDPFMRFTENEDGCDDAGRRTCDAVPPATGIGVDFNEGAYVIGDRFDAGLNFEVGSLGWREIALGSFSGGTRGDYALLIVGELPPRDLQTEATPDS